MKNKKIKLGFVAAVSGMIALHDGAAQTGNAIDTGNVNADSIKLEQRLIKLYHTKYTGKLAGGAMCYTQGWIKFVDYICSHCNDTIKERHNSNTVNTINQIDEIVNSIKTLGFDVVLDKTEYCPHCSKEDNEKPELIFKIRFSARANYHIARSNIINEYQCLLAFLPDSAKYTTTTDAERALHDNIEIIQKMTGLGRYLNIVKE